MSMFFIGAYRRKPKIHNIAKLISLCASQNNEFVGIFPRANDPEINKSFKLLKDAYIDARYNKNYKISHKQLSYLIERTMVLRDITEDICQQYIKSLV